MRIRSFDYWAAPGLDEALNELDLHGADARVLEYRPLRRERAILHVPDPPCLPQLLHASRLAVVLAVQHELAEVAEPVRGASKRGDDDVELLAE